MTRGSTYRVQLRPSFDFAAAQDAVEYLRDLGVSELYTSPILQARAGSEHGYDVVDHSRISADLGGRRGFDALSDALRRSRMGMTVDIVPNHMAIDGSANVWWWDVLENGPSSRYANYFDIDWPGDGGRSEQTVLVPILGERYSHVLEAAELVLSRTGGSIVVRYHDHELPVSPRTLDEILARAADASDCRELEELAGRFAGLPHASRTDPEAVRGRHDEKELLREELAGLCVAHPEAADAIDAELEMLAHDPEPMDRLLRRQNYRLAYWRVGREELDYRRFFNIETLVGLRVQEEQVFADTHAALLPMVHEGRITGLRVDHIDGLSDPGGYLERLHRVAPETYVRVEKILTVGEELHRDWPVAGTTGYDFLAAVNNLVVDPSSEESMTSCYSQLTGEVAPYEEVALQAKRQILLEDLGPELERLTRLLFSVCDAHWQQRDRTHSEVREALLEMLANFPVYRTYVQPDRAVRGVDRETMQVALRSAQGRRRGIDPQLLQFIGDVALLQWPGAHEVEFALALSQLSAPVMAKGAEDTAFYRYNRLVSLNEVGGDPGRFGSSLSDFHDFCARMASTWPESMLTLATHDTKRSPDVRARINVLSEIPAIWHDAVTGWLAMTDRHSTGDWPDYNARYLLFQTMVGTGPIESSRMTAYMDKAAKEAKVYTSWTDPSADYDYALRRFVEACLSDEEFLGSLDRFLSEQRVVESGRLSSLSQTALLLTCPGTPDLYQGTEVWDDSLVDPDNRRPVDFAGLAKLLELVDHSGPYGAPDEGSPKMWLASRILRHRRSDPQLYTSDRYEPLDARGPMADHIVAFVRDRLAVVVPRHHRKRSGNWSDTTVSLPAGRWRNVLTGAPVGGGPRAVADILDGFAVAVVTQDRDQGI